MKHTPEEIKYRLSDLGVQIGNIAIEYIADLEKENAELKEKINILENCNRLGDTITEAYKEQLTQAEEIIKGLLSCCRNYPQENAEKIKQAEQFLKEIEK